MAKRPDGRAADKLRTVRIESGGQEFADGSVLISTGKTRVLCAVSVEDRVPPFLGGTGKGWITAEYAMLPRSTNTRTPRERTPRGRTQEIQRLIGRSLRAVADLKALGPRTLTVDCDVLQADGGTRTAAITGAYVAVHQALASLVEAGTLASVPLRSAVAATSVGVMDGSLLLDLCYEEDSEAGVDFNVVMTDAGEFVEVQGTAEGEPFSRETLDEVLSLAAKGTTELFAAQREAIAAL
jgi:ribonuclease PH